MMRKGDIEVIGMSVLDSIRLMVVESKRLLASFMKPEFEYRLMMSIVSRICSIELEIRKGVIFSGGVVIGRN